MGADGVSARDPAGGPSLQNGLQDELDRIARRLRGGEGDARPDREADAAQPIDALVHAFDLSPFERDVLLMCAGVELDAGCAAAVATLAGVAEGVAAQPTFAIALAGLAGAHWSALAPTAPLRRWRLVDVGPGPSLVASPLRIDERILHYLTGLQHLDERLTAIVEFPGPVAELSPNHAEIAARMAAVWDAAIMTQDRLPILELCGADPSINCDIAAWACAEIGSALMLARARNLPSTALELETMQRLWEREAILADAALLISIDEDDAAAARVAETFAERAVGPLILSSAQRLPAAERTRLTFDVGKASPAEQKALWLQVLGQAGPAIQTTVDGLICQFDLKAAAIRAAAAEALGALAAYDAPPDPETAAQTLWDACREQARPKLTDIVQRIMPAATWDDLVLPAPSTALLEAIVEQVKGRPKVYGDWGFAARGERGLGVSALFAGPSGAGKTMAAEVIANALRLDLYRVDLSAVVNKYIGETEKNLRRVFDAAEAGGAILLFDEADALFGKRSEVKDSHDRFANIEVSYLLQRIEAYRGVAILTTNLRESLDTAFLRRLRFVVPFPYPAAEERERIWARAFPPETPVEALDFRRLAQLNLAGGGIRNIAINAAFRAAAACAPLSMADVREAARNEYAKLDKTLTDAEVRGW